MKDDSPNPDFNRPVPPEDPDAEAARLYHYHREAGTLGTYYQLYPRKRPWDWGLTDDEKAAIRGQVKEKPRGRAPGGNER